MVIKKLAEIMETVVKIHRNKATDMLAFEVTERENIFVVLLLGSFVGLPAPPTVFAIELLPYLEKELQVMFSRNDFSQDPLGSLMGMLNVD